MWETESLSESKKVGVFCLFLKIKSYIKHDGGKFYNETLE